MKPAIDPDWLLKESLKLMDRARAEERSRIRKEVEKLKMTSFVEPTTTPGVLEFEQGFNQALDEVLKLLRNRQ